MFLNTTLYLLRHETVKRQGNKSGRNRQPVKICFRQSHNAQQNKCITLFGILKIHFAQRELNCLHNFGFMIMSVEKSTLKIRQSSLLWHLWRISILVECQVAPVCCSLRWFNSFMELLPGRNSVVATIIKYVLFLVRPLFLKVEPF